MAKGNSFEEGFRKGIYDKYETSYARDNNASIRNDFPSLGRGSGIIMGPNYPNSSYGLLCLPEQSCENKTYEYNAFSGESLRDNPFANTPRVSYVNMGANSQIPMLDIGDLVSKHEGDTSILKNAKVYTLKEEDLNALYDALGITSEDLNNDSYGTLENTLIRTSYNPSSKDLMGDASNSLTYLVVIENGGIKLNKFGNPMVSSYDDSSIEFATITPYGIFKDGVMYNNNGEGINPLMKEGALDSYL